MTKKLKEYCVHVYPRAYEYENIMATTPEEAEMKVINGEYDDIDNVEVMRTCACGTDNDNTNKKCEECGEVL